MTKQYMHSSFKAENGDMLVGFSDGVVHAGVGKLLDLGWQYDNIVKFVSENISHDISPVEMCSQDPQRGGCPLHGRDRR